MSTIKTFNLDSVVSNSFEAPKSERVIISLVWEGVVNATTTKYFFKQSNIDALNFGDDVPAIPNGITITDGDGSATIVVKYPANKFFHSIPYVAISGGTIKISEKIEY